MHTELKDRPPSDESSDSETSDGEGGRIKRKFKAPNLGINAAASGKVKVTKSDEDSDSDTSDGEGGRIKRKLKIDASGYEGARSSIIKDDNVNKTFDGDHHKERKYKLPKFKFGSLKKSKAKKRSESKDSSSYTSDGEGEKNKVEVGMVELEGGIGKTTVVSERSSYKISDRETPDDEGGMMKRKFKMPKFGFGNGASGKVEGSKPDKDSGSETSDGEGGRVKRKFKMPNFRIGGELSEKVEGSKPDEDSGSETSDDEGGRVKRKFRTPKFGFGGRVSTKVTSFKSKQSGDKNTEYSDEFTFPSKDIDLNLRTDLNASREESKVKGGNISREVTNDSSSVTQIDSQDIGLLLSDFESKTTDNDGLRMDAKKTASLDISHISKESVIQVESKPQEDFQSTPDSFDFQPDDVQYKTNKISLSSVQEPLRKNFGGGIGLVQPTIQEVARSSPNVGIKSEANPGELPQDHDLSSNAGPIALPKSTSVDIDNNTLKSNIEKMGAGEIKDFIFQPQSRGRPSLSSSETDQVPETRVTSVGSSSRTLVKETFTLSKKETEVHSAPSFVTNLSNVPSREMSAHVGGNLPSSNAETKTTVVTKTIVVKSPQSDIPTGAVTTHKETRTSFGRFKPALDSSTEAKTSTMKYGNEIHSNIDQMDAEEIKKLIFTSSRTGRLSMSPDKDEPSIRSSRPRSEGYFTTTRKESGESLTKSNGARSRESMVLHRRGQTTSRVQNQRALRRPVSLDLSGTSISTLEKDILRTSRSPKSSGMGIKAWQSIPDMSVGEERSGRGTEFTTFAQAKEKFSQMDQPSGTGFSKTSSRSLSLERLPSETSQLKETSSSYSRYTSRRSEQPMTATIKTSRLSSTDSTIGEETSPDVSEKTKDFTQQPSFPEVHTYRQISKETDTDSGLEVTKRRTTIEQRTIPPVEISLGTRSSLLSEEPQTATSSEIFGTSSRTTITTRTHVRKVPGLSRTYPELLNEEIRQVKEASKKTDGSYEEKWRHSMERKAQWMLSTSPTDSKPPSIETKQEPKRMTLRDRRRLILGDDDDVTSEKAKHS